MDLSIDDCGGARVFRYYEDFNGIVEDNGLQGLIDAGNETDAGYKSRMKARRRLLVENMQPPVLNSQISRLIDLERRDCKSNDVALFELILEHAKVQQRFHRMSQDYAAKSDSKSVKSEKKQGETGKPAATASPTSNIGAARSSTTARPSRSPPQESCLACKGPHWLKNCPSATDEQREEARKKYRGVEEQRSGAFRSKAARYAVPGAMVRLNGLLEAPYAPDTGADRSFIPQCFVSSLRNVQPSLSTTPLSTPVDAKMADGRSVRCNEEVRLDLELVTIAGTVSMRLVACVVLPGDGDEFLRGQDALRTLGIDVEAQLAQVAGPSLFTADNDDFPVGDGLPERSSEPDTNAALGDRMVRGVANGLPAEYIGVVQETLTEYQDVWRKTIGPGPPALVEPLRVTIQDGAVPHRSAPRRYFKLSLFESMLEICWTTAW
ncbi:hypothetical protein L917_08084 [Phytophthora nicotianae]|uniref:Uncharacterized protein n=1 Tax=Phytophthora nicotianae TaxID=4792 RepID=W2L913_PHYNI|nr:hypothetical protein L917_08084 [Phytophthora nicotianae]